MLTLDMVQTLAVAGLVLFGGYGICRFVPLLSRYNVPAPVVGGLVVAGIVLIAHLCNREIIKFDTTLQKPLMIAFFTTIGFGASLSLLKKGGPQVVLFFAIATVVAVLQNVLGVGVAWACDQPPLFGVLCGSVALTGGPGTALTFAEEFKKAGVEGAASIGIAAALAGIISGGLVGGPLGTFLIERRRLRAAQAISQPTPTVLATHVVEAQTPEPAAVAPVGEDVEAYVLLKNLVAILLAMLVGSWLDTWFQSMKITLPAYIGAMIFAAIIRNLDDLTGWIGLSQRTIDDLGNIALSLFIVLALMTLKLWELAGLATPLLAILAAQVVLIIIVCVWPVFPAMGRDYEAAVMSSGFCGFMLGTTANAMANMKALVERYGVAPRAFLIVPMVGAFFIDFTNALIITGFLFVFK